MSTSSLGNIVGSTYVPADEEEEVREEGEDSQYEHVTLRSQFNDIVEAAASGLQEFEVEQIVGSRVKNGEVEYLVRWKNYSNRYNEWVAESNMNSKELLEEYNAAMMPNKVPVDWESDTVVRVGQAWLVPYGHGQLHQYCWVVYSRKGTLRCRDVHKPDCPVHQHHVNRVQHWITRFGISHRQMTTKSQPMYRLYSSSSSKPLSFKSIPWATAMAVKQHLHLQDFPDILSPTTTDILPQCKCGGIWESQDTVLHLGSLYTFSGIRRCTVMVRWCLTHKCRVDFDGSEWGIFNYSGKTLVGYDVLQEYLHCALASGMTFSSFCTKMTRGYRMTYGREYDFLGRSTFLKVYMAYAKLRTQPTDEPPCSICGRFPPVLQADATDLGMPLKFVLPTYRSVLPSAGALPCENRVLPFRERVLIASPEARRLLTTFVTGEPGKMVRTQWNKLLQLLHPANDSVADLLQHLLALHPGRDTLVHFHFAGVWTDILKVVGSHNSVTDLVRHAALPIAALLANGENVQLDGRMEHTLARSAPLVLKVYVHYGGWPAFANEFLQSIVMRCTAPFEECYAPIPEANILPQESAKLTGHWYASLPIDFAIFSTSTYICLNYIMVTNRFADLFGNDLAARSIHILCDNKYIY
jgi:hypothetical protein